MRPRGRLAAVGTALLLAGGVAACGDDGSDDPGGPGSESEIDGREAGTGGDTTSSTTTPAGSPPGDPTGGGGAEGGTEGNQGPPAG